MLNDFGVQIALSFGNLKDKIWRIGNIGYSSRKENVLHVLNALEGALAYCEANIETGKAIPATMKVYH